MCSFRILREADCCLTTTAGFKSRTSKKRSSAWDKSPYWHCKAPGQQPIFAAAEHCEVSKHCRYQPLTAPSTMPLMICF